MTKPSVTGQPRALGRETVLLLGVSLGYSAAASIVEFLGKISAGTLANQQTVLNAARFPGRPWLDLVSRLVEIGFGLVPAMFALHLLDRDSRLEALGFRPRRLAFDGGAGLGLAALIGIPGLAFYWFSVSWGINTSVVPAPTHLEWWSVPVLIAAAFQNGFLEEVVVVGYLTTRLKELGWGLPWVVAASALLRATYHLYQGWGGFLGNAVMGIVFVAFFLRVRRIGPLITAHTLIDAVAFVGYAFFPGMAHS